MVAYVGKKFFAHIWYYNIYLKYRLGFSIFYKSERKNHIKFKTKSKDLKRSCMYVFKQLHLGKRSNSPWHIYIPIVSLLNV